MTKQSNGLKTITWKW